MDVKMESFDREKLDISEVRKSLFEIREKYKELDFQPIYLSDELSNGLSIEQFSYRFSIASHMRRHSKSNSYKSKKEN